ncbi:MAG: hypothetical protein A2V87_11275 [Deltaproteobacteria bacterium RBG_16_58_17]|nr:MAG: hypothetical protein A2V87_11275 [Deltaproteobacteria bacterium RBG_16_58_17]OHE16842.1 MAG: hypothetical protein A2X96_03735 [Syntrophobacterales bacterium GWC2_56_13]
MIRMHISLQALVLALIAVGVLLGCSPPDRKERVKVEMAQARQKIKAEVDAIRQRTGADTAWKTTISTNERVIVSPLYSIDLERAWLRERPILFIGQLVNVATEDGTNYRILVRDADLMSSELRLELICPKPQVDIVLRSIRSSQPGLSPGGIGVAAKVSRVAHHIEPEKEGSKNVFTGYGKCIDLVHLGDTLDLMFLRSQP